MATLVPYLTLRNASDAIEFYKRAFGATEVMRLAAPDGRRIMHATLQIGDSHLMLSDEFPDLDPTGNPAPQTVGGTTVTIHIHSADVDQTIATAAAAGATVLMPPADMFWGDRFGKVRDPFGHEWSVSTPKRQLTTEQVHAGMMNAVAQHQQQSRPPQNQEQQQQQQ